MCLFELVAGRVEILDLEAEMGDAAEIRPVRAHVERALILVVEDRQIDVAVRQEHGAVRAAAQFLEAERLLVEFGDLRRLLGRQRDMPDACHRTLPWYGLTDLTTRHRGHRG